MSGRKPKWTPEIQAAICDVIKLGATYAAAAEYVGICTATFYDWMNGDKPYELSMQVAVRQANAEARIEMLKCIKAAAKDGEWRAAAFILERRFRDEYGASVELSGSTQRPIVIKDEDALDDERLRRLAELLAEAQTSGSPAAGVVVD